MTRNLLLFSALFSGMTWAAMAPLDPKQMERQFIELVVSGHKLPLDAQMHPGCTKRSRNVGETYSKMMNEFIFGVGKEKQLKIVCAFYDPSTSPFKAPKKNETPVECSIQNEWKTDTGTEKLSFSARLTRSGRGLERKYLACQVGK